MNLNSFSDHFLIRNLSKILFLALIVLTIFIFPSIKLLVLLTGGIFQSIQSYILPYGFYILYNKELRWFDNNFLWTLIFYPLYTFRRWRWKLITACLVFISIVVMILSSLHIVTLDLLMGQTPTICFKHLF